MKTILTFSFLLCVVVGFGQADTTIFPDEQITLDIRFAYNKSDIQPESFAVLDSIVSLLLLHDTLKYEVGAHSDCRGSNQYSTCLTCKRAKSVAQYFIDKGVDTEKLRHQGYGEEVPRKLENGTLLTCDYINKLKTKQEQEIAHQKNRRIVFTRIK